MENKLIYEKMSAILSDVETIKKDSVNKIQGYKFRGIDDMYNALHDIFAKHNVFITSEVLHAEREERKTQKGGVLIYSILTVKNTFHTTDGSSVSSVMIGEAMDSGDKASNKAMSAALKYSLMQTFLIPTDEKLDTENNSPEPAPKDLTVQYNIYKVSKRIDQAETVDMLNAVKDEMTKDKSKMTKEQQVKLGKLFSEKMTALIAKSVDGEVS